MIRKGGGVAVDRLLDEARKAVRELLVAPKMLGDDNGEADRLRIATFAPRDRKGGKFELTADGFARVFATRVLATGP